MYLPAVKPLLDFIAKPESGGDYNIVWGGIKHADRPYSPLVKLTIGEVLDWQDSIDRFYMSEAAGRYQIMEDTLRGLYQAAGLTRQSMFDEKNQDLLAVELMKRRGLEHYLSGQISETKFAQSLSMEWASLPCTIKDRRGRAAKGQSYYAGDGLNKSHVSIQDTIACIKKVRAAYLAPPEPVAEPEPDHTGWGEWLIAGAGALLSLFFGRKEK